MATTPRNAPCPCGSGKKHKNCCLGKTVEIRSPKVVVPAILCVAGVLLGLYVGAQWGPGRGVSVGAAVVILVGLLWMFRDPPPPSGSGRDPGAINFGG